MTKTPTPASHAVNTAPISADLRGIEHIQEPDFDLSTAAGGRGYVAWYFASVVKRHDFTRYLNDRLAYDFACALASHLQALRVSAVQQDTSPAQPSRECLQQSASLAALPEPGSTIINDACWKFIETMPHELPGKIFNDLKPAVYAAVQHVHGALQASPPAPAGVAVPETWALIEELVRVECYKARLHQQYMGKAMPDAEYERFQRMRDERIPELWTQVRAALAAAPAQACYILASTAAQIAGDAYWALPMPAHWDKDKAAYSEWCAAQSKAIREAILAAAAPAQAVAVPAEVDLPDVEDMAHSAVQEALSYGVSHDVFHRWMRAVMDKTVQALAAAPAQEHATQLAGGAREAAVPPECALVPIEPTAAIRKAAADGWLNCDSKMILNKAAAAYRAGVAEAMSAKEQA